MAADVSIPHPEPHFWEAPVEFLIHGITGAANFAIIGASAVGLDFLTKWLETKQVSAPVILCFHIGEYSLAASDLILFIVFLYKTMWRIGRKL